MCAVSRVPEEGEWSLGFTDCRLLNASARLPWRPLVTTLEVIQAGRGDVRAAEPFDRGVRIRQSCHRTGGSAWLTHTGQLGSGGWELRK